MNVKGKAITYGDDVNTDVIIPARYLNTSDDRELAAHCMEDIDKSFPARVAAGCTVMVAGRNFGCGSSREHAPLAIKTAGVSCVIAADFARIFFRNSINIGLPIVESPEAAAEIKDGDEVEVRFDEGKIFDITTGAKFDIIPFPPFLRGIIEAGGLLAAAERGTLGK